MKKYKINGIASGLTDVIYNKRTYNFQIEQAFNPYTRSSEKYGIITATTETEEKAIEADVRYSNGTIENFTGFLAAPGMINPLGLTDKQFELIAQAKQADPDCVNLMVANIMEIANDRLKSTVPPSPKKGMELPAVTEPTDIIASEDN